MPGYFTNPWDKNKTEPQECEVEATSLFPLSVISYLLTFLTRDLYSFRLNCMVGKVQPTMPSEFAFPVCQRTASWNWNSLILPPKCLGPSLVKISGLAISTGIGRSGCIEQTELEDTSQWVYVGKIKLGSHWKGSRRSSLVAQITTWCLFDCLPCPLTCLLVIMFIY